MSTLLHFLMIASMIMTPALLGGDQIKVQGTVAIENDTPGNVAIAVFDEPGAIVGMTNTTDTGDFGVTLSNNTPGRYKIIAISDDAYGGVSAYLVPAPVGIIMPSQNITVSLS